MLLGVLYACMSCPIKSESFENIVALKWHSDQNPLNRNNSVVIIPLAKMMGCSESPQWVVKIILILTMSFQSQGDYDRGDFEGLPLRFPQFDSIYNLSLFLLAMHSSCRHSGKEQESTIVNCMMQSQQLKGLRQKNPMMS